MSRGRCPLVLGATAWVALVALVALGVLVLGLLATVGAGPVAAAPGTDPGMAQQWGLERIGAQQAWATGRGAGAVIAIVDSGVDLHHEDLRGRVIGSINCVGSNGDPTRCGGTGQDDDGH